MNKPQFETPDFTQQNIDKIAALFPGCVTEMRGGVDGKVKRGINFEMLKQMLSPDVVDGDECYEFTWVGKRASIVEANKPIRKTLRPCPEESKDWDATENLYIEGDKTSSTPTTSCARRKRKTSRWGCTTRTKTACSRTPTPTGGSTPTGAA